MTRRPRLSPVKPPPFSFRHRRTSSVVRRAFPLSWITRFRAMLGRRHTVRAHFWHSLATYTQQGFGFILGVLLARILTPDDFGVYAFALATVTLVMLPASWSLAQLLVARAGHREDLFGQVMAFAWRITFVKVCLVSGTVMVLLVLGHSTIAWLCLMIGGIESLCEVNQVLMCDLHGRGEFKPNFQAEGMSVTLAFLLAIPAALAGWGPYALAIPGGTSLASHFLVFWRANPKPLFHRARWHDLKGHFLAGFWLWVDAISALAFARVDNWFIGRFVGASALGHYNRAYNYAPVSFLALSSLTSNPTVARFARAVDPGELRLLFGKTLGILLAGGTANFLVLHYFSDPLVVWVFGPQWRGAIPIFKALAGMSLCYAVFCVPFALMYSRTWYRRASLVRLGGTLILLTYLLMHFSSLDPLRVAWVVQSVLLLQGIVLFVFCIPILFSKNVSQMPEEAIERKEERN